ncbi:terpene synthase family protein [Streptomyces sp. CoH17]|uniref:terpene synthase family protein n=1 Tax=Streptomyces sp. CoH17 TaxID=2992806 RepID=UPI00226E2717|nr:terpene synthase family protein [Streptomyces sp. CoH17]
MTDLYIECVFPFPESKSTDTDRAREANRLWVKEQSLVRSKAAVTWYERWDMAKLAGYLYPYGQGEHLDVATDGLAFFFLFDDQFDGPLGRTPGATARVCQDMVEVVHGGGEVAVTSSPLVRAFGDFWRRMKHGMSPGWQARAAHHWEYYFSEYPHEAFDRRRGQVPDWEHYLLVRRGMGGTETVLDLCERVGGFEVPPVAYHAPPLMEMRSIVRDLLNFCNDVHSVHKEEPRGDVDNLVLVVEHERGCSRAASLARISGIFEERLSRFATLGEQLPQYVSAFDFTPLQTTAISRYVEALGLALAGHHRWEIESGRFTDAKDFVPADRPGYLEDLINRS